MKKLLIIPVIMALALYSFYHHNIEGEAIYDSPSILTEMEEKILTVSEEREVFSSKKESNISTVKPFEIKMLSEINTTRDHELEIQATVKNVSNPDECNFWWYEEGELIAMGIPLTMSFDKGEHLITLKAKTADGNQSSSQVRVIAWDYKKLVNLYYDTISETFETQSFLVFDHQNRLVLRQNDRGRYKAIYNESNRKEEESNEIFRHPEWNNIRRYSYTEFGEIEITRNFSMEEELISIEKNFYDEEGNLTHTLFGYNEKDLEKKQEEYNVYSSNVYEVYDYSSDYYGDPYPDNKLIEIRDENNLTTYREYDNGYSKEISKYEYDANQTMRRAERISHYQDDSEEITINLYDEEGQEIQSEKIYKEGEEVLCHYSIVSIYDTNRYQLLSITHKILDGDCNEMGIYNKTKKYTYDSRGRTKEIKIIGEEEEEQSYTSYKALTFYSNTLEGDEQ